MAHDRSHVENATIAAAPHVREDSTRHQECTDQTRVDDTAELSEGEVLETLADVRTGVVDEDVDRTELLLHGFAHRGYILLIGHIRGEELCFAARRDDRRFDLL